MARSQRQKKPSDKEIENKKKETDEEKNGAGIDALARGASGSGQRKDALKRDSSRMA